MVIVAAVDRSSRAEDVVEHADMLADTFGEELHVVHVMKRSEVVQAGEESVSNDEPLDIESLKEKAKAVSNDLINTHSPVSPSEAIGLIGDPASSIVGYASDENARYIVVSPQRRSRTGKVLFGSVAQSVLLDAPCPVVSLIEAHE